MAEDLSQQERDLIANLVRDGKPVPARYIPSISETPLKAELIWPGKSTLIDSTVLPFQSIEHIDEPRKGTDQQYDLFSVSESTGRQSGGWTNKLIWGDNALILSSLINGPLRQEIQKAGGLKLVYIDPPFDVGADFSMEISVGDDSVTKNPSVVEEIVYRDTWGQGTDSYIHMIYSRLRQIHDLLADDAYIVVHVDWHVSHHLRMLLDETFGSENFVNEIIWHYYNKYSAAKAAFPRAHDNLLVYKKGNPGNINPVREERDAPVKQLKRESVDGKLKNKRDSDGNLMYQEVSDKKVDDVWRIPALQPASGEWTGYNTQKHHDLLSRVIEAFSSPGDLVGDFFCGSGTTLVVAERMQRKWIGADLGRFAIHTSRKRLISEQRNASKKGQPFRAFEILNIGAYERAQTFIADGSDSIDEKKIQDQIKREDFVELILSAYGAIRSDQLAPFSGSKGGTAILIGALDSAVTQDEVQQAIDAALAVGISRIDVLGFEFEMGISPAMSDAAKEQGLTLTIRYIPNEVFDKRAIAKGQVKFYEAGYVEAVCDVKNRVLKVTLTDFGVFYRQDDADETAAQLRNSSSKVVVDQGQVVRVEKDKKGVISKQNLTSNWQDWIDYWAVDFDFASQPEVVTVLEEGKEVKKRTGKFIFENEWQSFRSKASRSLELTSAPFTFAEPGSYSIAVKVIDIFGNDTTRVFKIKVK